MKFIARRDFFRAGPMLADVAIIGGCKGAPEFHKDGEKEGKSKIHDNVIHRGAIIEIGKFTNEVELRASKTPEALLVAHLRVANCISDASNKAEVEGVERDLAVDRKREEEAAKRDKTVAGSDAAEALLKLSATQERLEKLEKLLSNPKVQAALAAAGA